MRLETDKGKSSSEVGTWNHRGIYDLRESKLLQSTLLLNVYKNNSFGYYRLSNPHVFHVLNNLACAVWNDTEGEPVGYSFSMMNKLYVNENNPAPLNRNWKIFPLIFFQQEANSHTTWKQLLIASSIAYKQHITTAQQKHMLNPIISLFIVTNRDYYT